MNPTKIEYLTHTWNPIAMRCTPVSAGCAYCWHLAMAKRLARNPKICNEFKNAYAGAIPPVLIHTEIDAPLHKKKPTRIGVQFMGDLFHEDITDEFIDKVFETICGCRGRHSFFILSKREKRMFDWFDHAMKISPGWFYPHGQGILDLWQTFIGVSVENQATADERIPILLQTRAAHRWVSIEPMLGPVDLSEWFGLYEYDEGKYALKVGSRWKDSPDWIVCGGETGPGARPMEIEWARSVVNQCRAAGVPVFVKQLTINGRISKDMSEWPEDLRIKEMPER